MHASLSSRDVGSFMFCPKLIVLNAELDQVLLAARQGEQDFDAVYSFIGGKMELSDGSIMNGIAREKAEEVGSACAISVALSVSSNTHYVRKDGRQMILPHYPAVHTGGDIVLNEEYSDFKWIPIDMLESFEPKINNITELTRWAQTVLRSQPAPKLTNI